MLTAEQIEIIAVDLANGSEPRITGPEADALRVKLEKEFAFAREQGWEIDIPFEVLREDL
jgi:hypothetical protein